MRRPVAWLALFALAPTPPAHSFDFERERVQGLVNVDVSWGLGYRTEDPDPRLVGLASGGRARSVNGDDGNLNNEDGLFSNMVRGTGEVVLVFENVSAYARGAAFHDWEQNDRRDRTDLTARAQDLVGSGADLLDHYVGASFALAGAPFFVRLGDQVVNWSETSFVRDGLDLLNPFDGATVGQPASQAIDSRKAQGMLWFAASPTNVVAVEGYYQYDWKPLVVPPVGTYYSTTDLFGGDGTNAAFFGGGTVSDLGTDLDARFALPAGTLGFDARFDRLPGRYVDRARDGGQYGLSVFARFLDGLATKIGVNYFRYHSRLPIISGLTGGNAAVAATSQAAVDARAAELLPAYLGSGLPAADANAAAAATAEALVLSDYTKTAGFYVEYPEDIDAIGASLSLSSLRTGTLFSGEIARHFDVPFQFDVGTVLAATRSPVLFDPTIGTTPLGEFAPDSAIPGYRRGDRTQAALGVLMVLGPRFGATQFLVSLDAASVHIHDQPGADEPGYQGSGRSDDSWGMRILVLGNYSSVLGGLNVSPRVVHARDVDGTTPGPTSTFVEGRTAWSFGIAADYLLRFEADLAYTRFSGGGASNLLRDRDTIQLRLTYSF